MLNNLNSIISANLQTLSAYLRIFLFGEKINVDEVSSGHNPNSRALLIKVVW